MHRQIVPGRATHATGVVPGLSHRAAAQQPGRFRQRRRVQLGAAAAPGGQVAVHQAEEAVVVLRDQQ